MSGIAIAATMAMTEMTTRSSTRLNTDVGDWKSALITVESFITRLHCSKLRQLVFFNGENLYLVSLNFRRDNRTGGRSSVLRPVLRDPKSKKGAPLKGHPFLKTLY